jgi:hypothetical protein
VYDPSMAGSGVKRFGSLRGAGVGLVLSLAWGCSDGAAEQAEQPSEPGAQSAPAICPQCRATGGETSDFGNPAPPDPCRLSEVPAPIERSRANELGFGALLDAIERTFELPLEWTPQQTVGGPASGYAPQAVLHGTTRIRALEHRVPALAGCEDSVRATLHTTLETSDGAIAIAGDLVAPVTRDQARPYISGRLDLSSARGTLVLAPPESPAPLVGYLTALIYPWPDGVRVELRLEAFTPGSESSDTAFVYRPLDGRAPLDHCNAAHRPLRVQEPAATPQGESLLQVVEQTRTSFDAEQPFNASWSSGGSTTVTVTLGQPFDACLDLGNAFHSVSYKIPLEITSGDGRVAIAGEAHAHVDRRSDSSTNRGFFEIPPEGLISRETFDAETGIRGVDFGATQAVFWYTAVYFGAESGPGISGEVTVEGIDGEGGDTRVIESLGW